MPKATPLKKSGGKLVSAKSKTGNPQCSAAMSVWVRNRKGGTVPEGTYSILAKCRAQSRQNKAATAKQASGKLAPGRGTWQRSEAAKAALATRAARNATRVPLPVFADRVHAAVAAVPKSKQVGGKVWAHHAHEEYQKKHGAIPLADFKAKLAQANNKRHLDLGRADMVEAYKPADVKASSIAHMGAEFNFVRPKAATQPNRISKPDLARVAKHVDARLKRATAKLAKAERDKAKADATPLVKIDPAKLAAFNTKHLAENTRASMALDRAKAALKASKSPTPAPSPERIATKALSAFHQIARDKVDHSGAGKMVAIHEIRAKIRQELGDAAASPAHFDAALKKLRADGKIRLMEHSDARDFTAAQHKDMIPSFGAGGAYAWVRLV